MVDRETHGEYLLPLLDGLVTYNPAEYKVPDFDLVVPGDGGTTGELLTFMEFNEEESVFHSREQEETEQNTSEETKLPKRHFLRTCEVCLEAEDREQDPQLHH